MASMAAVVISERVRWSQIIILVNYSVLCSFCLLLLAYLRVNRHVAFKGDANASRKVILPAFEPLLWILALVTAAFALFFCIAINVQMYTTSFPKLDSEIIYAGRQFVFVFALVFLCQKSVSVPALRRAMVASVLLASYTIPIVWLLTYVLPDETKLFYNVRIVIRPLLLIFVLYVCIFKPPAGRASPFVLRIHAAYIVKYHVLIVINSRLQQNLPHADVVSYLVLFWGSFCPFFIWSLLRADTEYWRGMGERVCALQQAGRQSGQLDESISSNRIHLLIEMHKDFVIDFAHLELCSKIGAGASASVFSGRLRRRQPVAVKVYTPHRFTEEVVAEFSHEAALCASLRHPNIVEFYGMCVCPPTICLVSELCQGSLEDILYAQATTPGKRRMTRHLLELEGDTATVEALKRQQLLLNIAYMLDCARAVAYVHNFNPPFLHRDIKPANFLVDRGNNVKLTDFGDSRRLPRELSQNSGGTKSDEPQTSIGTVGSSDSPGPNTRVTVTPQIKMTVIGTVCYMPPEMINGRTGLATYGEAADVYSLAITFWDIIYPDREKYDSTNPMIIFESVLNGCRPPLEDSDSADTSEKFPSKLRNIITQAWQQEPSARPTMAQIVRELECIQEELLSVLAQDLSEDLKKSGTGCHVIPTEKCFTGEFLIERMEDLEISDARSEAVRLGRALMDAGFLHHLRHERGFEDSNSVYYFDDGNINFCQPLAMLEEATDTESDDEPSVNQPPQEQTDSSSKSKASRRTGLFSHLTNTFSTSGQNSSSASSSGGQAEARTCACRLRGQRQKVPTNTGNDRQNNPRMWRRSPRRNPSQTQRLESSGSSSYGRNSSIGRLVSPKRWKRKKKHEEDEDTLTHNLLDEAQDHTIDVVDEEVRESLSSLARSSLNSVTYLEY